MLLGSSGKLAASVTLAFLVGSATIFSSGDRNQTGISSINGTNYDSNILQSSEIKYQRGPFFRKFGKTPGEYLCSTVNEAMYSTIGDDISDPAVFRRCVGVLAAIGTPPTYIITIAITTILKQMVSIGEILIKRTFGRNCKEITT